MSEQEEVGVMTVSMNRFNRYRQHLFEVINVAIETYDGHKSYEGALTIKQRFPCYFEDILDVEWCITLDCYVLGPARHYEYRGKTLSDCLDRAETDLAMWEKELQVYKTGKA